MYCRLPGWAALRVSGPDAAAFLQGQFTNDVAALAPGEAHWNGWCSPKGRLLATFALARVAADAFCIVVPADVAPGFVKRLRMFVLRSKVVVEPLEAHRVIGTTADAPALGPVAGVDGDGSASPSVDDVTVLELREPAGTRRLVVCPNESAALVEEALEETAMVADALAWDQISIRAGVASITVPTQDLFVPQMLNWDLVGGVNFRKGCYPGQEIVARMQYLGRLKERLFRAHVDIPHLADGVPVAGAPLYGATFGSQACGTIVNVAPAPGGEGFELLAVIQVASAGSDVIRIRVDADAPPLRIEPLPYAIPAPSPASRPNLRPGEAA